MKHIKQFLPITDWLSGYQKNYLNGDLSSGITVGIMLIPQGMAYALIAGLPPVYGLYASIVPQLIYAVLGTSRQLSVAPVAMDSLLVASGIGLMATEGTEAYIGFAIMVAFFMGSFQFLLGVLRLGFITNLLAKPVISGFTSAAAIIIGINQIKYLIGVDLVKSNKVYEVVLSALSKMSEIHLTTLAVGIAGIFIIVGLKKVNGKIPGSLIAVILGIAIVYIFNLEASGVAIVKTIPKGLPAFRLPNFTLGNFNEVIPLALTISVVAYMEAFSVAKSIEAKKRSYKVVPNQELIALGTANIFGSFFQSFPVTGGFSRSAVNYQSGAHTPLASVISASLIGLTLVFLTPLFYYLPNAILASVIMVAVYGLIDFKYIIQLWKENKVEFGLLITTLVVTLLFSMVPGIVIGIILSILILLYKSAYPHIAQLGRVKGHHEFRNIDRFNDLEKWDDLLIIRVDAPLSFINIQYFKDYIDNVIHDRKEKLKAIIVDAGPISQVDASAVQGLKDLINGLKEQEIDLMFCELIGPVRDTFYKTNLIDTIGREHIFFDLEACLNYILNNQRGEHKDFALQSNV